MKEIKPIDIKPSKADQRIIDLINKLEPHKTILDAFKVPAERFGLTNQNIKEI